MNRGESSWPSPSEGRTRVGDGEGRNRTGDTTVFSRAPYTALRPKALASRGKPGFPRVPLAGIHKGSEAGKAGLS
jgi:hypothetical protein